MAAPKVLILRAAGVNCDEELSFAFKLAGGVPEKVHVNRFVEGARKLSEFDILGIPGGFTYGDDIAAGRVLGNELTTRLKDDLLAFVEAGKPVIGICNGFQVLVNTRLLPGKDSKGKDRRATLTDNDSARFEDRWVHLKIEKTNCLWTKGLNGGIAYFPVAHGEGNFLCDSKKTLKSVEDETQVVFRYANADGSDPVYPANPNGSQNHIAGVCNIKGNVLGLMPHPERHTLGIQHPSWTKSGSKDEGDGLAVFKNAVSYVK
jgi:phosphoribosylformylglycinamidine synthase subunit PurQ / glutaminase